MKQISAITLLFFCSCFGTQEISNRDLSSHYRSSDHAFQPEFYAYQFSEDSLRLYIKFDVSELLFSSSEKSELFTAQLKVYCRLLQSYDSPVSYDTAIKVFTIPRPSGISPSRLFSIELGVPARQSYLLDITLTDVKRKVSETFFENFDAMSFQSRNSFLAEQYGTSIPFFKNYFDPEDSITVKHRDSSVKNIFVKYYYRNFPLAAPPFSFDFSNPFDYKHDSIFQYHVGDKLILKKEGFYQFLVDQSKTEGFTLFRFSKDFPSVASHEMMIETVRYLTTKREYEQLKSSPDKKKAIDNFWIEINNSPEKASYLIKKYYGRVKDANHLFTSYTEGWRTDRGMIYIVFGPPHTVYRSSGSETWIYGQAGNPVSLNFNFNLVFNPFTSNDYTLSRTPIYESNWHQAVSIWRQGRVYNDYN